MATSYVPAKCCLLDKWAGIEKRVAGTEELRKKLQRDKYSIASTDSAEFPFF